MEFEEIRKALEEEFGPDALLRNEPDGVDVGLDEFMTVSVVAEPTSHEVVLFAEIGVLPDVGREEFYEQALKANWLFAGGAGAVLAINPETGVLSLNRTYPMNTLDKGKFLALARSFAETYNLWTQFAGIWTDEVAERVIGGEAEDGAPEGAVPSAGEILMDLRNGFIRG